MPLSGNVQRKENKIKYEMARRTRSTTNRKNEPQNTKKSPNMSSFKSKQIIVGNGCQVLLPECNKMGSEEQSEDEKDECLWSKKSGKLSDDKIIEFCRDAFKNYGIEPEQALYILLKSEHNLTKAKSELASRNTVKKRFSAEDAFDFREAHRYFGKNFAKIRQMLPHKTLPELVDHYYLTKKQQNYKSFTDFELAAKNGASNSSDDEEQTQVKSELHRLICEGCQNEVLKLYSANGLELCKACKNYFKVTNKHRVCAQPIEEKKRIPICPPEMQNIAEQFEAMARMATEKNFEDISDGMGEVQVEQSTETVCEQKIKAVSKAQEKLKMEVIALQNRLMTENKKHQSIMEEARKFVQGTAPTGKGQRIKPTHTWSELEETETKEALIAFAGDCKIVAEILGTKTADMVNSFYRKNEEEIQRCIKERRKIIEQRVKAEEEVKKRNKETIPDVIVLDD